MSNTEYKCGFRVNIESLRGKNHTEALAYFRTILGEPSDVEEFDGEVEYFKYNKEYQPNSEYSYDSYISKDDGWFIDKIINVSENDCALYLTVEQTNKTIQELKEKFGVEDKDIMIFAYSWYNGSDEPRYMQVPNES